MSQYSSQKANVRLTNSTARQSSVFFGYSYISSIPEFGGSGGNGDCGDLGLKVLLLFKDLALNVRALTYSEASYF